MPKRTRFFSLLLVLFLLLAATQSFRGQACPTDTGVVVLNHVTSSSALPNGIDVRDCDARMQIVALRDNVVRIRVSKSKNLPEDASWAVFDEARRSRVEVKPTDHGDNVGFQTKMLHVFVNRKTFALTIVDGQGNVLQQDARPVEFHGDSFRVYKTRALDEHYFGLGDKPGPIDRR